MYENKKNKRDAFNKVNCETGGNSPRDKESKYKRADVVITGSDKDKLLEVNPENSVEFNK